MRVILKKRVPSLGEADAVCEVNEGYARNFLFPRGLAEVATEDRISKVAQQKKQKQTSVASKEAKLAKTIAQLDGKEFTVKKKCSEQGRLFSAIHVSDVVALLSLHKFAVPENAIHLTQPLKQCGSYRIVVSGPRIGQATLSLSILEER